jgi:cytochrome b6-f complex iron-sulfur subunit
MVMDRKKFLNMLGIAFTGSIVTTCLGGCTKEGTETTSEDIDLNLDLTSSSYSKLQTKGNYVQISSSNIVVAYSTDGNYYAADLTCPHEDGIMVFDGSGSRFQCTKHPKQFFSKTGLSNGAETRENLKMFSCTLNGSILNIKG